MIPRDTDGYWLSGLVDGEGMFLFYVRQKRRPGCYSFDFQFGVSLRADDAATLNEVRRILDIKGSWYTDKRNRVAGYKGKTYEGKPLKQFRVHRKSEIAKVIEFFRKYPLRSKKQKDFVKWAEAFEYYCGIIASQPIRHVRFVQINLPNAKHRRPFVGTPKAKLRRTPPELIAQMQTYARQL